MQRYFSTQKIENKFILDNNAWHHIKNVMRMRDGDKIEVVYQKELYMCEIKNQEIYILDLIIAKEEKRPYTILLMPVLKEQKVDYILQKSTELGVAEIIPIQMNRCNINYNSKKEVKRQRWQKICQEASEQAKRVTVPIVHDITTFKNLSLTNGVKILCSTDEKQKSIKNVLKSNYKCDKLYIGFGPEGGFSKEEEDYLKQEGFVSVTLGERILRSETVPLFVLSVINYEYLE